MVPSRSSTNTMYVEELGRIVLKDKETERTFGQPSTVRCGAKPPFHSLPRPGSLAHAAGLRRKTAITTRVMQLVHELCRKGPAPVSPGASHRHTPLTGGSSCRDPRNEARHVLHRCEAVPEPDRE